MLIDWFTVIAQAINFIILVWLMKRFLYKPILNAIDEREKLIAAKLGDAEKKEQDSQKEKAEFVRKNQDFDRQRVDLLNKATDEAQLQGKHLLDEAKTAAVVLASKQQETLKTDEHNLHQEIIRRTQQEVFSISRKVLTDLADANLDKLILEKFVKRLLELKASFDSVNDKNLSAFVVRSSSELDASQRDSILSAVKHVFGLEKDIANNSSAKIQFQTSKDLIGGVELTVNGQKIAWSISDYLKSLGQGVEDASPR